MFIKSLVIHPADNVAVVLEDAHKGDYIEQRGEQVTLLEDIEFAHKVALKDFAKDEPVYKYGVPIGNAKEPIKKGAWVHGNIYCGRGTKRRPEHEHRD